jgi:hypothetical protein
MTRDDEWWQHASEEEKEAEFQRMRRAYANRRNELEVRYPLLNADGWIDTIDELRPGAWRWAAAVKFVGLPLGHEASGLVVLSEPSLGSLWWGGRCGLFPLRFDAEPTVELASGNAALAAKAARSLWCACLAGSRRGLKDVPARCWDGIEAKVILREFSSGRTMKASCNACDSGREPALVLARRLIGEVGRYHEVGFGACG